MLQRTLCPNHFPYLETFSWNWGLPRMLNNSDMVFPLYSFLFSVGLRISSVTALFGLNSQSINSPSLSHICDLLLLSSRSLLTCYVSVQGFVSTSLQFLAQFLVFMLVFVLCVHIIKEQSTHASCLISMRLCRAIF